MDHLRKKIHKLRCKLLEMSNLVESSIDMSISAAIHQNTDAIEIVFDNETVINQMEQVIDEIALELFALQQPKAEDLRFIMMAVKINTSLERMGDIALNIALYARALYETPKTAPRVDVPHMAKLAQDMIRNSLDSFARRDAELARKVLMSDDEVDAMCDRLYAEIRKNMAEDASRVNAGIEYLFIARGLERLADHATNIAEDVLFFLQGIDVRHNSEITAGESPDST